MDNPDSLLHISSSSTAKGEFPISVEELLYAIIDVIVVFDVHGYIRYVSNASNQLWGYEPGELVGHSFTDFILPEDREETLAAFKNRAKADRTSNFSNRYFHKDGSVVPITWSGRVDKERGLIFCVARDGREKEELERRLYKAQQIAGVGTLELDLLTNAYTYISPVCLQVLGLKKEAAGVFTPEKFRSLLHPADRDSFDTSLKTESGEARYEYRLARPDGSLIYVSYQQEALFNSRGDKVKLIVALQDITERKINDDKLRQLSLVAQKTNNAVVIVDLADQIVWANAAFILLTEYGKADISGQAVSSLLFEDAYLAFLELKAKALTGRIGQQEVKGLSTSGKEYWLELQAQPIFDDANQLYQILCVIRDITARKKHEAQLAISEFKFKSLVEKGSDLLSIIDSNGFFTYVSQNAANIVHHTPESLIGRNAFEMVHPDDLATVLTEFQKVVDNQENAIAVTYRFRKNNGEWIWLESKGTNHLYHPAIKGFLINTRDIHDRVLLQHKLDAELTNKQKEITAAVIKAQELERSQLGLELHDNVNQVLTTVKLYNEMYLSGYVPDKELLKKSTDYVQDCINEIRSISKRLSAPTLGNISLQDSIRELVESINLTNRLEIEYSTEGIDHGSVTQDQHLAIYRIVQEGLNNIIKYAEARKVRVEIRKQGKWLTLHIADDGRGFDPNASRSGIGITNMKTRAENLNGSFLIKSSPGEGCRVDIAIPLTEGSTAVPKRDEDNLSFGCL